MRKEKTMKAEGNIHRHTPMCVLLWGDADASIFFFFFLFFVFVDDEGSKGQEDLSTLPFDDRRLSDLRSDLSDVTTASSVGRCSGPLRVICMKRRISSGNAWS